MPSTFTNNGGIELPADGEKDGVWGDVVNLNMQIVDRLTNGVGAIPLTGTTHDLVTTNGNLDGDGHYALIVFGGSPSGTNTVTISPNDAQKTYFVKNETSQDVVITQGSGGNATVAAGKGAIVYANGAGTGSAVVDLTAAFVPNLAQAGITASVAELNTLDGITASTAELNILDGVTATAAELNTLDGITASTAELNLLTGASLAVNEVTATAAELNTLDGVTATTAELNILDGVTATTAELNYVDGVTSPIQAQINDVNTAVSEVASVPSGTVIHVAMQTAPSGYLKADGTAVSRTTYAALFAAIGTAFGAGDGSTTFNLPDLRGEFVRGFDDGRGVDSGRAFGSAQANELESHRHRALGTSGSDASSFGLDSGKSGFSGETSSQRGPYDTNNVGTPFIENTGGTETRPRNVALLACIKV